MKRLALLAAVVVLAAACERAAAPKPAARTAAKKPAEATIPLENDNLLNLVFGAAAIDRYGELSYEATIAHALDGTPVTAWRGAPGGKMSATLSFAAPTRLRRLGVTVGRNKNEAPARMVVEASLDGTSWQPALDAEVKPDGTRQMFDVDAHALYLRVHFTDPTDYYGAVLSIHANGSETAPALRRPIAGCWLINHTMPARFEERGARVFGTIDDDILVDGGTDGRVYRLMWREGMQWGFAAVTVSADGNHLSGVRWHEEVNPQHNGDGWLGRRVPCTAAASLDGGKIADAIIARTASWRMYGVRFDRQNRIVESESDNALDLAAKIIRDHPKHQFRLIAREFREPGEEKNVARADAMLTAAQNALARRGADLSRVALKSAGPERHALSYDFTSQRVMDSSVELQVLPSR